METININASDLAKVNEISKKFNKGQNVTLIISKACDDSMNKGRGENKNPYIGHLTKVETYGGWCLGIDYNNACQNAAVASGSTEQFVANESWHIYFNDFFEVDKKTKSKFYLKAQVSERQGSKVDSTYYLDGKEIDKDSNLFADISKWFKKKTTSQSSSQIQAGISAEYERRYIVIKLENVRSIIQGDRQVHYEEEKSYSLAQAK